MKKIIIGILVLIQIGCSTARKAQTSPFTEQKGKAESPSEVMGPPLPPSQEPASQSLQQDQTSPQAHEEAYGPAPVTTKPIVLVLGPGLAKGFAYAGVFQALKDAKIPVAAVLGAEMGAFVGALYAVHSNINQFEWALMKFKEELFEKKSGFLLKATEEPSDGVAFKAQLTQIFGNKDIRDFKIPMRIAVQYQGSSKPSLIEHGNAVEVLRAAMANPQLFTPGNIEEEGLNGQSIPATSAFHSRSFLIHEAKLLNLGPVVAVNIGAQSSSELQDADLVVHADLGNIGDKEFQKRASAIFRGKSAVVRKLSEIKQLVFGANQKGVTSLEQ